MPNELGPFDYPTAGLATMYFVIGGPAATLVNPSTGATMADTNANWPNADIPATDTGHSKRYYGDLPAAMEEGEYNLSAWLRAGVNPDRTVDTLIGGAVPFAVNVNGEIIEGANITHGLYRPAEPRSSYVAVTPFQAITTNPRYQTRDVPPIAQGSAPTDVWVVVTANGEPVNLSGKTVRLVAFEVDDPDEDVKYDETLVPAFEYQTGGDGIVIAGDENNEVRLTHDVLKTATAGNFRYFLWNITDSLVLAKGKLPIEPAVKDYP